MTKERARISILSELLSFPTISDKDWTSCSFGKEPRVGDLVAMNCAPATKYYLSWLHEINPNNGWPKYLLESVEDGEIGWWENIGLSYYDRKRVSERLSWRWDDDQFAFNDRWQKVCFKKNDAFIMLPCWPTFMDDGSVLLDVRIRHGFDDYRNPKVFPSWKKTTTTVMDEYYKKSLKEYESKKHLTTART